MPLNITPQVIAMFRLLRGEFLQDRIDNGWVRLMRAHPDLTPAKINRIANRLKRVWRELYNRFPPEEGELLDEPNFYGPFYEADNHHHLIGFVDLTTVSFKMTKMSIS